MCGHYDKARAKGVRAARPLLLIAFALLAVAIAVVIHALAGRL